MGSIVTYGYGSGSNGQNVPSSGYGSISNQIAIEPASGMTLGGDIFNITSTGLSVSGYVDSFQALSSNWTSVQVGAGTVSASSGLKLSIGNAGGTAKITSNYTCTSVDLSVQYSFDSIIEQVRPPTLTVCGFSLYMSSSTECRIAHIWDAVKGSMIKADVVIDNVVIASNYISTVAHGGQLTIRRNAGYVEMYAGTALVLKYTGWIDGSCNISIYATSPAIAAAINTTVSALTPRPVVLFDNIMAEGVVEYNQRHIIGHTPARLLPAQSSVVVVLINYSVSLSTKYLYVPPKQLTLSKDQIVVVVNNDKALRDIG